ncbi:MAG TPA: hypothetical protein VG097_19540, partial [Gemmata sp.]|nr:hypothetical protein [Gemmata sp.]
MPTNNHAHQQTRWIVAVLALLALMGIYACTDRKTDTSHEAETHSANAPLPGDIEVQVRNFCGAACHKYPPADTFPRK